MTYESALASIGRRADIDLSGLRDAATAAQLRADVILS